MTVHQVIALCILAWFVGCCFYIWDDIRECSRRALADEVGVERDASQTPSWDLAATTSGTFGASDSPYDRDAAAS